LVVVEVDACDQSLLVQVHQAVVDGGRRDRRAWEEDGCTNDGELEDRASGIGRYSLAGVPGGRLGGSLERAIPVVLLGAHCEVPQDPPTFVGCLVNWT
jgi:hypothetical protein